MGRRIRRIYFKGPLDEIIPPPVKGYPNSIELAGLRTTWDVYDTAGSRVNTYTGAGTMSLSSGVTRTVNSVGPAIGIASTNSLSAIDFTGYSLWVSANGTVATVTDCLFPGAPTLRVYNGQNTSGVPIGAPTLNLNHCTMNLAGGDVVGHQMFQNFTTTNPINVNACRIYNAPRTSAGLQGTVSFTDSLFGAYGTTFVTDDHTEALQLTDGTFTINRCLFDPGYSLPVVSGITGDLQFQALNGVTSTLSISNSVFVNSAGLLAYPLSFKADFANVTVTLTNNVIQKGTSGYYAPFASPGRTLTVIDGGGNRDFDDGRILTLAGTYT